MQDSNTKAEEGVRNKGGGERGRNACDNGPHLGAESDFGDGRERGSTQGPSPSPILTPPSLNFNHIPAPSVTLQSDRPPSVTQSEAVCARASADADTYAQFLKPNFTGAPIKEAGRVAYLGMFRCFFLLVAAAPFKMCVHGRNK